MKAYPFNWPIPPGYDELPRWTGEGFKIGKKRLSVLEYHRGGEGWDEELAALLKYEGGPDRPATRASLHFAARSIKKWVPPGRSAVILEVGSANGQVLRTLRKDRSDALLIGTDYALSPLLDLAEEFPQVPLLRLDLSRSPLPDDSLDAVIALNVLEHIEDDRMAVQQIFRMLKQGGIAVIEVPASPELYDVFDKVAQHFRRYRMGGLLQLFRECGFKSLQRNHLGFFIFPLVKILKHRNKKLMDAPAEKQREAMVRMMQLGSPSPVLGLLFALEEILKQFAYMPFGLRCQVVFRKP